MPFRVKKANAEPPEVESVTQPETEIRPPDGGWGWVVCFAGFLTNFTVPGIVSMNGILLLELLELFNEPISKTTIVFSLISGAIMFGGPFASIALMFKASHRQIMMVGGIIAAASAVASSFAPNIETLIFTYGILVGLSLAVNYFSVNVTLGRYFLKKRALALGIATSGKGFGSFMLNYFINKIISFYGMRGTFLLIGGLFLNLTVYGALCRPLKPVIKQSSDISQNGRTSVDEMEGSANIGFEAEDEKKDKRDEKYNRRTSVDKMEGAENLGFKAEDENKETQDEKYDDSNKRISEDIEPLPRMLRARKSKTVTRNIANRKTSHCDATMLKNKYFFLLCAIYTTHAIGDSFQIYLPVYAVSIGLSREEAALIMAIHGICSIVSLLLVGFLADIIHIPISYLLLAALSIMSLGSILTPFCQRVETLGLCAAINSIGHNFGIALRIVLISAILGIEKITASYTIVSTLVGTLYIIYPIIKGFLYEATQHFSVVFYLDFAIAFLGAVLSCGIVYAQKTGKFVE